MKTWGWNSRYDSLGMSPTDKYFGRRLHVQDNYWEMAKPVAILAVVLVVYLLVTELCWASILSFFTNYIF